MSIDRAALLTKKQSAEDADQIRENYLYTPKILSTENKSNDPDIFNTTPSPDKGNEENNESLEERVKTLENQSNHLLYFVHFIYENFPDLVRKMLPSNLIYGMLIKKEPSQKNVKKEENSMVAIDPYQKKTVTPREMEVLNLLAQGLCAKEIANNLFISETTVITHKKNLKEKFMAKNTAELISKTASLLESFLKKK